MLTKVRGTKVRETKVRGTKVRGTKVRGTKVQGTKVRVTKVHLGTKDRGTKFPFNWVDNKRPGIKVLGTKSWRTKVLQPPKNWLQHIARPLLPLSYLDLGVPHFLELGLPATCVVIVWHME